MLQKAPPIAAPAVKVANAMGRAGPGGKALARIPSYRSQLRVKVPNEEVRRNLTDAGIRAAEPNPCIPRITSSATPAVCINA